MNGVPPAGARRDLGVAPGVPGSGRRRYAAAMDLWLAGEMPAEVLEVYRICAAFDGEDPLAALAARGLSPPPVTVPLPSGARLAVLVEALDTCLAPVSGPGIAETRAALAAARPGTGPSPRMHPAVAAHLPAALAAMAREMTALAEAIADAAPDLCWTGYDGYPTGSIGADFAAGHAYAALVGETAPLRAGDVDIGLFLIAPHVLYRDHRHAAPELYLPFTGPHGWRFAPGGPLSLKPALAPVWNDPFAPHLTKVGAVPFLCLYSWTRDAQSVAEVVPADDWPILEALRL